VASAFVRDIYEKNLKKNAVLDEARRLKMSRIVVIFSGVGALLLAYLAQHLIF